MTGIASGGRMAPSIKDVLIDVTDGRRGSVNPQMIIAIGLKVGNERVVQFQAN